MGNCNRSKCRRFDLCDGRDNPSHRPTECPTHGNCRANGTEKPDEFAALWVTDFPLLEWDDETQRYHAMHHPFTVPKKEDVDLTEATPLMQRPMPMIWY